MRRRLSASRIVLAALALAILVRTFFLDIVIVRGESMLPTLRPNTVLLVLRCAYGLRLPVGGAYALSWAAPEPGDLVVVDAGRAGTRRVVKRVFEVGPAFLRSEAGFLSARGGVVPAAPGARLAGSTFLEAGRAFVVGDNADESVDSRSYGPVPIEAIVGKVLLYGRGAAR